MFTKKIIMLVVLIPILFSFYINAANLYLGDFTPDKNIKEKLLINVSGLELQTSNLMIWMKRDYFESERQSVIPSDRLLLNCRNGMLPLNSEKKNILTQDLYLQGSEVVLPLKLTLFPCDFPGNYKNTLYIKQGENNKIIEFEIVFRINPWGKIKLIELGKTEIKYLDKKTNSIYSNGIPVFKVASNTEWNLYVSLKEEYLDILDETSLKIEILSDGENSFYQPLTKTPQALLTEGMIVAKGNMTTIDGNYWSFIPFVLSIDNYHKLSAGKKDFPLVFHLKTLP